MEFSFVVPAIRQRLGQDRHRMKVASAFRKYFKTSFYESQLVSENNWALYLRPDNAMKEAYGLEREVLCVVSEYEELEVRTLDSANDLIDRAGLRLEQDVFFLISSAKNAERLCDQYSKQHGRRIVFAPWVDIESAHETYPDELLRSFFFNRELFHQTTAVSVDGQFFGRDNVVTEILDNLRNGQNCGVFGLRKIGKTSVLERVRKMNAINRSKRLLVAYIDAQRPEINTASSAGVAFEIMNAFNSSWAQLHGQGPFEKGIRLQANVADASRQLGDFISRLIASSNQSVLLIIDELERILPSTVVHTHWKTEYLDLWRMLRATHQQVSGRLVFLMASTNPFFSEQAEFDDQDNPMYRFVKPYYLQFFEKIELTDMLSRLGRPMGIHFEEECFDIICREYGGHPFLSRQLCSHLSRYNAARPLQVSAKMMLAAKIKSQGQVHSDMNGILKIFRDYYPIEPDPVSRTVR